MGHMILSAIIHGLIYRAIWGLERGMGVHGAVALAVLIIGTLLVGRFITRLLFGRRYRRPRRMTRNTFRARKRPSEGEQGCSIKSR